MELKNKKDVYTPIGSGRLLDIIVFVDGKKEYEGKVEDAPDDIKKLKYSDIKLCGTTTIYYVETKYQTK